MRYVVLIAGHKHTVDVPANGHVRTVTFDGRELTVDWQAVGEEDLRAGGDAADRANHISILVGDRSYEAYVRALLPESGESGKSGDRLVEVMIRGRPYLVTVRDERAEALASLAGGTHASGDALIRAPMPGLVVNVLAGEGMEVKRGQTVVVLEAMKMENDLTAPRPGVVKSVKVYKGQTVNQGHVLAIVGTPGETSQAADEDE
jgi:biotin carboxyl carrier protein